jgi:hypothetical protein
MRRSMFALLGAALASMGTVGCEDGPNQTYSPTTGPAASAQNGGPGSAVDPATKDFGYLHGGTNANVLCDGPTLHKVWSNMDNQPLLPPTSMGGVNMAGADCNATQCSWTGLTIEQAEKTLCQGNNEGDLFGDGSLNTCWGDSNEVCAHYNVTTHLINFMNIDLLGTPGYNGALTLKGCAGTASAGHTYVIGAFTQMQRDGNNWEVDWNSPKIPGDWRNEFTSAEVCTFSGLPQDNDCNASGRCIQGNFGDVGYLYVPVLGSAIWVANQNAAQPQPSIMYRIDQYLAKVTPFALDSPYMKFDAVGPTASSGVPLGKNTTPCVLQMGLTYGTFLSQCVEVTGTSTDQSELNKLLGGIAHDTERFSFNITGVDVNFSDTHLMPTTIVADKDRPQPDDPASSMNVDQDTLGALSQDYINNDPTQKKDLHGTGLVYLQWARRVQRALIALMQAQDPATPARYIGDPACFGQNAFLNGGAGAGKGCTGFEEVVTPMPVAFIGAVPDAASLVSATLPAGTDPNDASMPLIVKNFLLGLKPGHQKIAFCDDHSNVPQSYATCDSNSLDVQNLTWTAGQGDAFSTAYQRVFKVLGAGTVGKLPGDAQDVRFFFKEWGQALLQYMKAEGAAASAGSTNGSTVTLAALDAQVIDSYNLFFDSIGAGQFESMEYVERAFTDANTPPLDFVFTADVKNGIQDEYHFERYLYRDEKALYTAMVDGRDGKAHPVGSQDTTLLTNVFGSPVLHSGWKDHTADKTCGATHDQVCGPKYTPYYCATHNDPLPCNNEIAPLDGNSTHACSLNAALPCTTDADCAGTNAGTCGLAVDQFGQPMLAPYEGAFLDNATAFTLGGGASPSVAVPITQVYGTGDNPAMDGTFLDIQQVYVQIPLHQNPYDMTSAPPSGGAPSIQVLTDYEPKQPGVGFPVALTGTHDRFIETYQADFSGSQVTANVDYDFQLDTHMQPTQQILFLAVETTDFLGDVFVCQDTLTKDLLTARMYTSVNSVLSWFAAHPNAYNDCQIIIRYSPYGNYADYITSLQNGVRLSVTQGGGYGRIVDGTLFDPTLPQN